MLSSTSFTPQANPPSAYPGLSYFGVDGTTDGTNGFYIEPLAGGSTQVSCTGPSCTSFLPFSPAAVSSGLDSILYGNDSFDGGITYDWINRTLWVTETVDCGPLCIAGGDYIVEYALNGTPTGTIVRNPAFYNISYSENIFNLSGCGGLAIDPQFNFHLGLDTYTGAFWETCGDYVFPLDIQSHGLGLEMNGTFPNTINFTGIDQSFPGAIEFVTYVPEPASLGIFASVLIALAVLRSLGGPRSEGFGPSSHWACA